MTSKQLAKIMLGACQFPYRRGGSCHCRAGICLVQLGSDMTGRRCDNCDHMLSVHAEYGGDAVEIKVKEEDRILQGLKSGWTPIAPAYPTQTMSAISSSPAKQNLVPDPVIQSLVKRAKRDPQLECLMRVVSLGKATQEQLRAFQAHIDDIGAANAAEKTGKGPAIVMGNPEVR